MGKRESSLRSAWFFLMVRSVGESGMGKGGREKITQELTLEKVLERIPHMEKKMSRVGIGDRIFFFNQKEKHEEVWGQREQEWQTPVDSLE